MYTFILETTKFRKNCSYIYMCVCIYCIYKYRIQISGVSLYYNINIYMDLYIHAMPRSLSTIEFRSLLQQQHAVMWYCTYSTRESYFTIYIIFIRLFSLHTPIYNGGAVSRPISIISIYNNIIWVTYVRSCFSKYLYTRINCIILLCI